MNQLPLAIFGSVVFTLFTACGGGDGTEGEPTVLEPAPSSQSAPSLASARGIEGSGLQGIQGSGRQSAANRQLEGIQGTGRQ